MYNHNHPQFNVKDCMVEVDYIWSWKQISTCDLPTTLEESENGKILLWEECQAVANQLLCPFNIEGCVGNQSYLCHQ